MVDRERCDLAAAQARVVAALVGGASAPDGFDPDALRRTQQQLLDKRRRAAARAFPALAVALGTDFAARFLDHASRYPLRTDPCGHADASHFAGELLARGALPASVLADYLRDHSPRRHLSIAATRGTICVAVRLRRRVLTFCIYRSLGRSAP